MGLWAFKPFDTCNMEPDSTPGWYNTMTWSPREIRVVAVDEVHLSNQPVTLRAQTATC